MLVGGDQKLVSQNQRTRPKPFSRELNKLFELRVPPVAQLIATGDYATMMRTWKRPTQQRPKTRIKVDGAVVLPAISLGSGSPEITAAIARTDMTNLKMMLSCDFVDKELRSEAATNAGFLFSTLVCGRSRSVVNRSGKCTTWDVHYSRPSGQRFGAMLSAFAEATSIKTLMLSTARRDGGIYNDPVYWSWLAYVFWSRSSRSSVQTMNISLISLTEAHVAAVERVITNNYPKPVATQTNSSRFGYVGVTQGTQLQLVEAGAGLDTTLILSQDCRCRAFYDESDTGEVADVVVPGYGICKVQLVEGVTDFVEDFGGRAVNLGGIRSMSLTLADVENAALVPKLFHFIGGSLQTLCLNFRCVVDRQVSLDLSAMASACLGLKELRLRDWNVTMAGDTEALQTWDIKKLSIRGSQMVTDLKACLSSSVYQMSRELVKLEVSPNRIFRQHQLVCFDWEYPDSLLEHDNEYLPVMKKKLPRDARCAMISIVSSGVGNLRAAQYLDSSILSIIFAFAATPERRSVQVTRFAR